MIISGKYYLAKNIDLTEFALCSVLFISQIRDDIVYFTYEFYDPCMWESLKHNILLKYFREVDGDMCNILWIMKE